MKKIWHILMKEFVCNMSDFEASPRHRPFVLNNVPH